MLTTFKFFETRQLLLRVLLPGDVFRFEDILIDKQFLYIDIEKMSCFANQIVLDNIFLSDFNLSNNPKHLHLLALKAINLTP